MAGWQDPKKRLVDSNCIKGVVIIYGRGGGGNPKIACTEIHEVTISSIGRKETHPHVTCYVPSQSRAADLAKLITWAQ